MPNGKANPLPPRHLWVLVYRHRRGTAVIPFWYEPNKQFPYPDTEKVAQGMKLKYDIDAGETLECVEITPKDIGLAKASNGFGGNPEMVVAALPDADRDEEYDEQVVAQVRMPDNLVQALGDPKLKQVVNQTVADLGAGKGISIDPDDLPTS